MLKTSKLGLISWKKDKQVKTNGRVPNCSVNRHPDSEYCTNLAPCFRVRLEKRHPVSDSKAKKYTLVGGTSPYGTHMALSPPSPWSIVHGGTSGTFPIDGKNTSAKSRAQKYERKNTSAKIRAQSSKFYILEISWEIRGNYMPGNFLETICW